MNAPHPVSGPKPRSLDARGVKRRLPVPRTLGLNGYSYPTADALLRDRSLCLGMRDRLREARAIVLADAEAYPVVVSAIEALGRRFKPEGTGLADYAVPLNELVDRRGGDVGAFRRQYYILAQSRNDSAHLGSCARNIASEALEVARHLEEALVMNWEALTVGDLMVKRPVFLETWNTLDEARALFMDNAFSAIPVQRPIAGKEGADWRLLTDAWLAGELLKGRNATKKKTLGSVFEQLDKAVDVAPTDKLSKLIEKKAPLFLVMEDQRLLGIITPSDLL